MVKRSTEHGAEWLKQTGVGFVLFALRGFASAKALRDRLVIEMGSFTDNRFAALTIVVAPAILTNASSVLCLGTANRLGRVMDRTRVVLAQLARLAPNAENRVMYQHQLEGLEVRSHLVLRALRFFYVSVGSFAAAALISLFGSIFSVSVLPFARIRRFRCRKGTRPNPVCRPTINVRQ